MAWSENYYYPKYSEAIVNINMNLIGTTLIL